MIMALNTTSAPYEIHVYMFHTDTYYALLYTICPNATQIAKLVQQILKRQKVTRKKLVSLISRLLPSTFTGISSMSKAHPMVGLAT